jgi:SAM-dependent methyltransferase
MTGRMPKDIEHRVIRASQYAAEAVQSSTISNSRILDVGCGYGVMTTFLQKSGIPPSQIHGIDLSTDMIRNAQNLHGQKGARFDVANFMDMSIAPANENDSGSDGTCFGPYSCIIFCSSLHDLPDMKQALLKARDLLAVSSTSSATSNTPKGRLVIVHPQGASHVLQQQKANPVLVPRGLPTAQELKEWLCEDSNDLANDDDGTPTVMDLKHSPADAKSQDEIRDGYIAVLDLR